MKEEEEAGSGTFEERWFHLHVSEQGVFSNRAMFVFHFSSSINSLGHSLFRFHQSPHLI